jgi:hypothetical protein
MFGDTVLAKRQSVMRRTVRPPNLRSDHASEARDGAPLTVARFSACAGKAIAGRGRVPG